MRVHELDIFGLRNFVSGRGTKSTSKGMLLPPC